MRKKLLTICYPKISIIFSLILLFHHADPCGTSCAANAVCIYKNDGKPSCACPLDGDDYEQTKQCSKFEE